MKIMNSPRSIDIAVTHRCNLHCSYCYRLNSESEYFADVNTQEWLNFFEELKSLAVTDVCLSGGEFFLRPDAKDLMEKLRVSNIRFKILSNGTVITDEIAAFIANTHRCNYIQISLDGATAEVHDSFRGEGSLKRAIHGLKIVQKHGIPLKVRVTIHKHNVYHLEEIAKTLLEDLRLTSFSTNSASYMGSCIANSADVMLNLEERMVAMTTLLKLNRKYQNRIVAAAGPLAEAHSWYAMEQAKTGQTNTNQYGTLSSCGWVFSKLAVQADGTITPCKQMPHIKLGKINKVSLAHIWKNHLELNRLRRRRSIPLTEFDYCKNCEYVQFCNGGCPALAFNYFGTDEKPDDQTCYRRFLEAGGKLPDEQLYS